MSVETPPSSRERSVPLILFSTVAPWLLGKLAYPSTKLQAAAHGPPSRQIGFPADLCQLTDAVKGYQMPAAESRRSTKTPQWIIAVEPAGYSGRR